jgi:hypothetical protein
MLKSTNAECSNTAERPKIHQSVGERGAQEEREIEGKELGRG